MALIVQDPSNPSVDANSYQSLADARLRAASLGVTLSTDDDEAARQILTGMQYVESNQFIGEEVIAFQGTSFPRTGIIQYVKGEEHEYPTDEVPQQIIDAVLFVAEEGSVYTTQSGGKRVKRKKIDVIDTEYFDDGSDSIGIKQVTRADSLLKSFIYKSPNYFMVV